VEEAARGVGGVHLQLDGSLRVQRQGKEGEESKGGDSHSFDSINARGWRPCQEENEPERGNNRAPVKRSIFTRSQLR
jgi:hypothetical protein